MWLQDLSDFVSGISIDGIFNFLNLDLAKLARVLSYDPKSPMIFSSGTFLMLFLFFSMIYVLLRNRTTARMLFVTAFSYYFYYKSSGIYFILMSIVTLTDFNSARLMHRSAHGWDRKFLLIISLCTNLGLLCWFKYTNFFYEMLCPFLNKTYTPLDIFLPVGISFFTFQSMSYTIDVYRRKLKPLDNLLDYAFYVSFFPQLVAGPIVRASDFIPQIRKKLVVTSEMFGEGVFLIMTGLFKKAVISDYISINFVERVFDNPGLYSGIENLLGVYGYALQIYCDFSGYSDMAIGIALLLGFRFPINFNSPYKAESVSDFWRRWHISLSSWLRDYLYISMGGNRKGKFRTYVNLIITMLLGGLWHGASWNFIVWGGLHGVALAVHKAFRSMLGHDKHYHSKGLKRFLAIVITFHFACFCWIFFRCADFNDSIVMIRQIFLSFHPELLMMVVDGYQEVFALMALGYLLHWCPDSWQRATCQMVTRMPLLGKAIVFIALAYLVIQIKSSEVQPFIYFQF